MRHLQRLHRFTYMHFTVRRIAGYILPVAGVLAAWRLHDPNAADHRLVAWLLPIGCLSGAVLLLSDFKIKKAARSRVAIAYGIIALVVGVFFAGTYVVFNGLMHR